MSNYKQSSQNNASSALQDNQRLKMRLNSPLIYIILIYSTTCCCLAFQEQSTIDLINLNHSRTSPISTDSDEFVSTQLISSSSSSNDTANRAANLLPNTQSESINVAHLTPPTTTNNITQDKLLVSSNSPVEQLSAAESRESPDGDFNNYSYSYNQDETQDGSDLNFSLMNAPHDKLQAVKHLLNTERSILASQSQPNDQSIAQGVSQQCTYKGKQYLNGQNVPIEEQPCLNCTCRRAILQCYLRVCPPIISLEAHKKMLALTKRVSGENCQMIKEPNQCCPTLKCDEPNRPAATGNFSSSPIQFVPTPQTTNRLGLDESDVNTVSAGRDTNQGSAENNVFGTRRVVTIRNEGSQNGLVLRIQQQPVGSATNRSVNENNNNNNNGGKNHSTYLPSIMNPTTSPSHSDDSSQQDGNLPKLTVIKGTSGQPDSILLITSNPSSVNDNIITTNGNGRLSSQQAFNSTSNSVNQHQIVDRSATGSSYSDALLNALLETVYSSVSQLNGLNLQGSCMINGSLYVEGSAVMPEGNAYCQYCYCIRQKIMCVKPKCHLMISGCSPKYSNEYACCPTSYSCTNSDLSSTNNNNNVLPGLRSSSISQSNSAAKLAISSDPQNLSAKLSAAIDSISRMSPTRPERQATSNPTDPISARQVDGSVNPDSTLQSAMMNLMNSIGLSTANLMSDRATSLNKTNSNGTETNPQLTFRTLTSDGSGSATSVPTTTTTTITTTTTAPPSSTPSVAASNSTSATTITSTTPSPSKPTSVSTRSTVADKEEDSNEDEGSGGEEEEEAGGDSSEKQQDRAAGKKKKVDNLEMDKKLMSTTMANLSTNTTTEQPSSVSDFLEPMNKLGPLIMSQSPTSSCSENGRQYAIGVQIPTLEACKHCYCNIDGVKECKKVECGLKTPQRNGCKPVIPEGHCCPTRYDCPPLIQINQRPDNNNNYNNNRYRFEESPFSQTDISQCDNEPGEACSNNSYNSSSKRFNLNSNLNNNYADQSGNSEIENIKGLSEIADPPPVVRTTRIVPSTPNWTPLPTIQPLFGANNGSNNTALNGLTEELNKFIMQINQNTTSTQGTGYSMINPAIGGNLNMNDTSASILNTHDMMINNQHSKMVDYHSVQAPPSSDNNNGAIVGIPSIVPEPIRNLMRGDDGVLITNGEIVPVDSNLGNKLLASTVEYAMNNINNGSNYSNNNNIELNSANMNHQGAGVSGSRDSRSTNAHRLHEIVFTDSNGGVRVGDHIGFIELANISLPLNTPMPQQLPSSATNQPIQPENALGEYSDGNVHGNNNRESEDLNLTNVSEPIFRQNVSNLPHVRLMRNNHNLPPETNPFRHLTPNNSPLVDFDDSVGNNNLSNFNSITNSNINNSIRSLNSPNNAYNTIETTANNLTQPPNFGRMEFARPVATSPNDDEQNSTPTPPQPTTGTPIGLDADRGPETRGWLKSLSGLVHSFGRRLVPSSTTVNELDGAASDGKFRENQARHLPAVETARSKQQSLFNHLMQILSNSEQQQQSQPQPQQQTAPEMINEEQPKSLVMRPLANVVQVEPDKDPIITSTHASVISNRPKSWPPILSSPYEPVSSSEIEIVTAATPSQFLDPELPDSTLAKVAESEPRNKDDFARRSDVGRDAGSFPSSSDVSETFPIVSVTPKIESKFLPSDTKDYPIVPENLMTSPDRSSFNRANKRLINNRPASNLPVKSQLKLTCYDPTSNKTYQANENWIPSDDNCKTCTCILGEERCQTLTCPEKPADNCKEERRSGECCPSYTCGTNLGGQSNINQEAPAPTTTSNPMRMLGDTNGSNAKMIMPSSPNSQQMAITRALNNGRGINNIDFDQQRVPTNNFPQQPLAGQARNLNSISNFPQAQQAVAGGNNQALRNTPGDANMRRQLLPQHPFRVNDLPNVLPTHLRFRPNFQGNQLTGANNLMDPNQQNKILFFNQGSSQSSSSSSSTPTIDIRFPLQNFISKRNDNNLNLRIPLNDVFNQIGNQKPARPASTVDPSILLHPQKATTLSGAFNQPFNGQTMNRNNLVPIVNGNNQNWRSPMMNDNSRSNVVNSGINLPSNILIPRMSGEQHQREFGPANDNNLTGSGAINWQPSNFMMPNNPTQATNHNQQPQLATTVTPFKPTIDVIPSENSASASEVKDKERVHFQAPPTNQLFSQSSSSDPPSVDSGFRPIVAPILTTQRSNTGVQTQEAASTVRQNDFSDSPIVTTSSPSIENRQQSSSDTTMPIEASFNGKQHEILSTQAPTEDGASSSAEYPSSNAPSGRATTTANSTPDDNSVTPKGSDRGQPGSIVDMTSTTITNQPSTEAAAAAATTTTTSSSTTTASTESSASKQDTRELSPSSQSTEASSSDQSTGFDSMSIFRVSECNIYGRIYPVGQVIKELSDSCKRCTCSSMGVECENNC